jgi:hypothetical protein
MPLHTRKRRLFQREDSDQSNFKMKTLAENKISKQASRS